MIMNNFIYGAAETRSKISEIQNHVKSGFISKMINKNTHDSSYMLNEKILDSLIDNIDSSNVIEYDEELKIYTVYNNLIPQIYAEDTTKDDALEKMVNEAISFAEDYAENIELFSNIFDGVQQFYLGNILLNLNDEEKLREILKIG